MKSCLNLDHIDASMTERVGGKAVALAKLRQRGYAVPPSLAIPVDCYRSYLEHTGLASRIIMELGRKEFGQMRWEEIWDTSLRIRNLFLNTPIPQELELEISETLEKYFGNRSMVVRSSAPCEDSQKGSFAGVHDSFVNVRGREELLLAIRKVWASLWSDRALLYRQEMGLDVQKSAMAVLVQELVVGAKSGVAFSRNPADRETVAVEAVWGLNQGLVDGSVEPDFWAISRRKKRILEHRAADRLIKLTRAASGLESVLLGEEERDRPPLAPQEVTEVAGCSLDLESEMNRPQDVEWTWNKELVILQSRPITTDKNPEDPRNWYLSLHRSLESLKELRLRIEEEILPAMEEEAAGLSEADLSSLSAKEMEGEIEYRRSRLSYWEQVYRDDCIPMAHGVRLFGEFYNDALHPTDPFEFVELLRGEGLRAVERNREITALAQELGETKKDAPLPEQLRFRLEKVSRQIGMGLAETAHLVREIGGKKIDSFHSRRNELEETYLGHFAESEVRSQALEILDTGRAAYRLRDDDNISLDKILREVRRAEKLGSQLTKGGKEPETPLRKQEEKKTPAKQLRVRQIQGQPASPGLVTGIARVVHSKNDMGSFCAGEILVCDAIDPAMTFIAPLAAGIVERRGGMLIHGAIIAREYGIPCVTGIADAAELIGNGDQITLDGYLGLVFFPPPSGVVPPEGFSGLGHRDLDESEG